MDNLEYLREFVIKHRYSSNIDVHMDGGTTWDNVVSVTLNPNDIPDKTVIPIEDIQFDILSDLPRDTFMQWFKYCKRHGYIEYKEWLRTPDNYIQQFEINSEFDLYKQEIENSINEVFFEFGNRYPATKYDENSDDDSDEYIENEK